MTSAIPLRFRPVTPNDHPTFVRLYGELGVDDPPPDLERFVETLAGGTVFAEDERGVVVAYAFYEILETEGFVRHVVVDASARGRGVGRQLMDELARRFRAAGCTGWRLNVRPDNPPALRLYEACGMRRTFRSRVVRVRWSARLALPEASRAASDVARGDHASLEAALRLPRGILDTLVRRGFRIVGARDEAGAPVGVAAFDPKFPGAYPFRARDAQVTRALLDACFERRAQLVDADHPWRGDGVQLVIEDAEAIADAVVGAGGHEVLVTLHYTGSL